MIFWLWTIFKICVACKTITYGKRMVWSLEKWRRYQWAHNAQKALFSPSERIFSIFIWACLWRDINASWARRDRVLSATWACPKNGCSSFSLNFSTWFIFYRYSYTEFTLFDILNWKFIFCCLRVSFKDKKSKFYIRNFEVKKDVGQVNILYIYF